MLKTFTEVVDKNTYVVTALLSLVISLWLFASSDIVSRDAMLYIRTAQAFDIGGLSAAFAVWKWPLYPIVIDAVHRLTGLNFEHSAYLLTTIFEAIISVTFVRIYSKVAFDGARLWVAMVFILTLVTFNDYKADIIRGYGFWTFTLIALYQFILYFQTKRKVSAILWQLSIVLATLFRPEAVVFAVLAPFYYLFNRSCLLKENIRYLLTLNSIFYPIGLLLVCLVALSTQVQEIVLSNLPDQIEYFSPERIFHNFNTAAANFTTHVLEFDYSARYSKLMLASGLLCLLLYKVIANITLVYSGIWLAGAYKHWINLKQESYIICYFALIAFFILSVFITSRLFVSSRYTVLLVLLLGLIAAQYLDYLLAYLGGERKKLGLLMLSAFIVFQFLDSTISTGANKLPIKQSGEWVRQNIDPGNRIACNEVRFAYYTQQNCFLQNNLFYETYSQYDIQYLKANNYSYLLLWVKHKNSVMLESLEQDDNLILLKRFENKKKDVGLVYKIKK